MEDLKCRYENRTFFHELKYQNKSLDAVQTFPSGQGEAYRAPLIV